MMDITDMTDVDDVGAAHRATGLTRAKYIERLTLWLGLPLLLALLCLTAGVVNYSPVHKHSAVSRTRTAPAVVRPRTETPRVNPTPKRAMPVTPGETPVDVGDSLHLDGTPSLS